MLRSVFYLALQAHELPNTLLEDATNQLKGLIIVLRRGISPYQQHAGYHPVALWGGATVLL